MGGDRAPLKVRGHRWSSVVVMRPNQDPCRSILSVRPPGKRNEYDAAFLIGLHNIMNSYPVVICYNLYESIQAKRYSARTE